MDQVNVPFDPDFDGGKDDETIVLKIDRQAIFDALTVISLLVTFYFIWKTYGLLTLWQ